MHPPNSSEVKPQQVHHARTRHPPPIINATRYLAANVGNTRDLPRGAGAKEEKRLRAVLRARNGRTSSERGKILAGLEWHKI